MSKIKIFIDAADEIYAKNLGKALALRDSLFSYSLKEPEGCQILLTDKIISADNNSKIEKPLIILSRNPGESYGCPYVYIYSGLERIVEEIYRTLEISCGLKINRFPTGRSKILCVISAAGGVGASVLAIALGKELAQNLQHKVLYISFEKIPSTELYFHDEGGKSTVNEYIYYCFKNIDSEKIGRESRENRSNLNRLGGKQNNRPVIDSFLIDDFQGMQAFRPGEDVNELLNLTEEELADFLNELAFGANFDYIILDMPGGAPSLNRIFLDRCHKILLVDDGGPLSFFKNNKWIAKWDPDFYKILAVTNKWNAALVDESDFEDRGSGEDDRFYVEYDPSSFEGAEDFLSINLSRRFGLGIRRIADELASTL